MHHLRESLLSPSPKGLPYLTALDDASRDRVDVRESAARGELEELPVAAFFNRTSIISERYCNFGDGVDSLEEYFIPSGICTTSSAGTYGMNRPTTIVWSSTSSASKGRAR